MLSNSTPAILGAAQESFTGFQTSLSGDHSYIHQGIGFNLSVSSGNVTGDGVYIISFTTPTVASGHFIHLRPTSVSSSANSGTISVIEGGSYTGGTDTTSYNRNRNSATVTTMQAIKRGTTEAGAGTTLYAFQVGSGGSVQSRSGGSVSGEAEEWVLKPNTQYSVKIVNGATTTSVYQVGIFWYEEEMG